MLGNIPAEGPTREPSENSSSPNLRLSDDGDKFTNGPSAYTITGIVNNIANTNQIFITLFIFSLPQSTYFSNNNFSAANNQQTLFLSDPSD